MSIIPSSLVRISNPGRIITNKGRSLINDLPTCQAQSLVLASAVLVASRVVVASASAIKAKGTPDGPYRYREFIRTALREILGFVGGFVVLRQLQKLMQKGLGHFMHIKPADNPNEYSMFKKLKAWCKNPTAEIPKFEPDLLTNPSPTITETTLDQPLTKNLLSFAAYFKPSLRNASEDVQKSTARQIYKLGPIVPASIITVALAGFLLERFTRDHSDSVVTAMSKNLGGKKTKKADEPVPSIANLQPELRFNAVH